MDANVRTVHAARRCAVEINALWYFLLAYLGELARDRGDARDEREWTKYKRLAGRTFLRRFWLEDERYLADVWKNGAADLSLRPNMVIAAALEYSPLSRGKRTDIVRHARAELLTPRGRARSRCSTGVQGRLRGQRRRRDGAYHQGTAVADRLLCEAYLRVRRERIRVGSARAVVGLRGKPRRRG
jgi:glycogen debranching enzyme